jgi:hypothetical protein
MAEEHAAGLYVDQLVWRDALAEPGWFGDLAQRHGVHLTMLVTERVRAGQAVPQIVEFARGVSYLADLGEDELTEFVTWVADRARVAATELDIVIERRIAREATVPLALHVVGLIAGRHRDGEAPEQIGAGLAGIDGVGESAPSPKLIYWGGERRT